MIQDVHILWSSLPMIMLKFICMMEEIFQQDKDTSETSRTFNFSIYIQFSVQLVSI